MREDHAFTEVRFAIARNNLERYTGQILHQR